MDKYLQKIKHLIAEKAVLDIEEVQEDAYFEDDLNIGEIEMEEIFTAVEEEFHISFEDEDKENVYTVGDLLELVIEKAE